MATKKQKKGNVPNLRFPGFDGEWKKKRIGELVEIGSGKDYKHLSNGVVPVFGTGGLMTSVDQFLFDGETVCIGRKGTINKPFYYQGKLWTVDTLFYTHTFKSLTPKFCFNLFEQINWLQYNEASGVPSLSKSTIEKIEVYVPSVQEQEKIAMLLFRIEERIQTQNKIIEQLESLIKKLGDDLFSQKLRFPGFQDRWSKTTVKEQCQINPKTEQLASEFVYVDLELVVKGELIKETILQKAEAPSRATRVLEDGDVLFQCVRPYQRNNYIYRRKDDRQWVASTGYAQIKTHNNPIFIYYLLNQSDFNNHVMIRCTGTSYPAISGNELAKIPISICSRKEQDKIAMLLSTLDEKMKIEKKQLRQFKAQKNYLLQNLFV